MRHVEKAVIMGVVKQESSILFTMIFSAWYTDSFMFGSRKKVNAGKSGHLKYLGKSMCDEEMSRSKSKPPRCIPRLFNSRRVSQSLVSRYPASLDKGFHTYLANANLGNFTVILLGKG